ncbi:MAG TPA: UDP-N-acetylmuramate dehydrogenase, partial [Candidatus Methylomirabilis sp.]|nr:UDP-N-acetylmuramate dehydrogenase [Candidatus Methylomirabilis sp.]
MGIPRGVLEQALEGEVLYDEPMSRHTSYRIGGPADVMVCPRTVEATQAALRIAREHGAPVFILGGGSNLLVRDGGLRGLVLNLFGTLQEMRAEGEAVTAGSGAKVTALVNFCARRGLAGLEPMAGVPGTVGGAVKGNAGAFGVTISDHLASVRVLELTGEERVLKREALRFAYRQSSLTAEQVLVSATFRLRRGDAAALKQKVAQILAERRAKQPVEWRSAGSVFKNPPGDFAGRLIEGAGLKGTRVGDAMISPKHGNFFLNLGRATARDVLALIALAQERVRERTGVSLELEVR